MSDIRIINHKLTGDEFYWESTPNMGGVIVPEILVLHDTAGRLDKFNSVGWLRQKRAKASAHLVLERDGTWTQMVPFNRKAFHAGKSNYRGRANVNNFSLSIEIVNVGRMDEDGMTWWKQDFSDHEGLKCLETKEHGSGCWLDYTEAQLSEIRKMSHALVDKYNLKDIVGHFEVSPRRKVDTNPLFPLEQLKAEVFGRDDYDYDGYVTVNLRVRERPDTDSKIVDTLKAGTEIDIVSRAGDWFVIYYMGENYFIHGDYVKEY